jgi:hypothetical protein
VSFPKVLAAAVVACAVSLLPASHPASAQGATPSQPTLKKSKERGASPEAGADLALNTDKGGMTKQRRLSLCMESWDAQTHMSKREWRFACERSVKDYPDAFR